MQITFADVAIIIGIIGGILGILAYLQRRYTPTALVTINGDITDLRGEIELLKKQVGDTADQRGEVEVLKKQMGLFWGVVEKQMSQLLHSPHRPVLDFLLDKNNAGEPLSDQEARQLVNLLQKLIDSSELSPNEVSWATMLMAVTVAKYELES